jgi:NADH-quinone oxidoreductase subunit A
MGLNVYTPILVLFILATLFAVGSIAANSLVGPKRFNRAKLDAYECGIEPSPRAVGSRMPVKFYLTAMLFIVFDIEIIFLYPWAVAFQRTAYQSVFLFVEMLLFVLTVFVAYVYVLRRGGLEWD